MGFIDNLSEIYSRRGFRVTLRNLVFTKHSDIALFLLNILNHITKKYDTKCDSGQIQGTVVFRKSAHLICKVMKHFHN